MTDNPPSLAHSAHDHADPVIASFTGALVELVSGDALDEDAVVETVSPAKISISSNRITADDGDMLWVWPFTELRTAIHAVDDTWTILGLPGSTVFGISLPARRVDEFRQFVSLLPHVEVRHQTRRGASVPAIAYAAATLPPPTLEQPIVTPTAVQIVAEPAPTQFSEPRRRATPWSRGGADHLPDPGPLTGIDARNISAWFGERLVLDRVSLVMAAGEVTALIGPSGCGKSTFLRILNRMHEMIPSAAMAGQVLLDSHDIYDPSRKLTDARREIGMVFQKPNPFPAMSIYDNVLASFRLTGFKASQDLKDDVVETCLAKAGLWNEVKDRLRQPGGGLSGGQQQRLCIARALAIRPRVLLMDEPCSALDPTSTRRIEETITQLASELTIVIVTHNMQQAARVSHQCAFFLAEQGTPGVIVEHGPTDLMFGSPQDPRTSDYVMGRFG